MKTQQTNKTNENTELKEALALIESLKAEKVALSEKLSKAKVTKEFSVFFHMKEDNTKAKVFNNCDMIEKLFESALENNEKAKSIYQNKLTHSQSRTFIKEALNFYVNSL